MPLEESRKPIQVEATVKEALPHAMFRVELIDGESALAHVAEEARVRLTRILPGDKVTVEIAPHDLGRGRILERMHC
jgi:translation initiation factor IF-1